MKDRSTVLCIREGEIILVAHARSRWSLPGGTIKRSETPLDAAWRELAEETNLLAPGLIYLFQFGGLSKRHHVFFMKAPRDVPPKT